MTTVSHFDEEILVDRLRQGNMETFNAVYWQYHEAIYRNILRFTKDEAVAADLLQDVFVKFWEKRETLKSGKTVSGLLFVISYHLSINYSKRLMRDLLAKNELALAPEEDDPEEHHRLEAQHELLEEAIEALTEKRRLVFTRCKLEGKTYEEVAAEMGISKHTVKEHLSLAMKSVKTYIQQSSDPLLFAGLVVFLECV